MIITDREVLKRKCKETTIKECQNLDIFSKLDYELRNSSAQGVGLSSNQIGFDIYACIIRPKPEQNYNMINPKIEEYDLPFVNTNEGCLSFPNIRLNTNRYNQVTCQWIDFDSGESKRGVFYGLEAIVVQHEVDHLNGITIFDRIIQQEVKVGRNELCPCGSGKKYKKCCLK